MNPDCIPRTIPPPQMNLDGEVREAFESLKQCMVEGEATLRPGMEH